jgi:D-alanine-D-alanine ligase
MTQRNKIRVAVLYGGRSGEHEVSLNSATNVIDNLDRTLFDVMPIGIDKQGEWYLGDELLRKELGGQQVLQLQCDQDKRLFTPSLLGSQRIAANIHSMEPLSSARPFDVVFPVMHGVMCEDGTIQGLLESADIPYVGCGVLASAVGMEKDISKRLIKSTGIPVPHYLTIKRGLWDVNSEHFCRAIAEQLTFPVFVKPANTGSSVGVHKVKRQQDLRPAILDAFQYDTKIIVEQGIDAIELELAVLESLEEGREPTVSVVGEVTPTHEFYSYAAKYLDKQGAELLIPARISAEIAATAKKCAATIFNALECEGMARVDLFLDRKTHQIYFNEVNTIPGFTQISMYPKLMTASGISYSKLLTHLILLAIKRHEHKNRLNREYVSNAEFAV